VAVAVSVAGAAAALVVVAAAASVVAATSVTAAALELTPPPPPFPPRPPRPPLPRPTLPESASVFVVAIDRTTSAADDIWAGGAEGAGGEEGTAAAGTEDLDSHCRFLPPRCGSRYCQLKSW
jgi:hypothetical protein